MSRHVGQGHAAERNHGAARFAGAEVPAGRFADDDGSTPPAVAAALEQWRRTGDVADLVAGLLGSRLLVALVAVLDSADPQGAEKDSHMAAAMLIRPDGRKALVAFTSVAGLAEWQPTARPLPVAAPDAARAAIDDGADALLIDGDCALSGAPLWALAEGRRPQPPIEDEVVRAAISEVVGDVLAATGLPSRHELVPDVSGEADVVVLVAPSVAAATEVVGRLAADLSAHPVLRSRLVRGLALGTVPD